MPVETEIKIRVDKPAAVRKKLRDLGYEVHAPRVFESNTVFDTVDKQLRSNGELLRLRRTGRAGLVTYKGIANNGGPHKSREEIETTVSDPDATQEIFSRLRLAPAFRYEKYRTEYKRHGSSGIVTIDETPIGNFLELEGAPGWIDKTARKLGYSLPDYITKSYGALYVEYCRDHGLEPSNMVFDPKTEG